MKSQNEYFRLPCRNLTTLMLTMLFSFSSLVLAEEQGTKILVQSCSKQGPSLLIEARLGDKRIELTCALHEPGCKSLKNGAYFAVPVAPEDSVYQDCENMTLYESNSSGAKGARIAVFCLLTK
jgi:hypothetical protein